MCCLVFFFPVLMSCNATLQSNACLECCGPTGLLSMVIAIKMSVLGSGYSVREFEIAHLFFFLKQSGNGLAIVHYPAL